MNKFIGSLRSNTKDKNPNLNIKPISHTANIIPINRMKIAKIKADIIKQKAKETSDENVILKRFYSEKFKHNKSRMSQFITLNKNPVENNFRNGLDIIGNNTKGLVLINTKKVYILNN